jgi:hypothetical protein
MWDHPPDQKEEKEKGLMAVKNEKPRERRDEPVPRGFFVWRMQKKSLPQWQG